MSNYPDGYWDNPHVNWISRAEAKAVVGLEERDFTAMMKQEPSPIRTWRPTPGSRLRYNKTDCKKQRAAMTAVGGVRRDG